jgi:hypothetical protein
VGVSKSKMPECVWNYEFCVNWSIEEIIEFKTDADADDDNKNAFSETELMKPSGLGKVLIMSCWNGDSSKYKLLDFTGTTNYEAIEKVLMFYKHKTYWRCIEHHHCSNELHTPLLDHIFFQGFYDGWGTEFPRAFMGS